MQARKPTLSTTLQRPQNNSGLRMGQRAGATIGACVLTAAVTYGAEAADAEYALSHDGGVARVGADGKNAAMAGYPFQNP
jgi:hypothetical protein